MSNVSLAFFTYLAIKYLLGLLAFLPVICLLDLMLIVRKPHYQPLSQLCVLDCYLRHHRIYYIIGLCEPGWS